MEKIERIKKILAQHHLTPVRAIEKDLLDKTKRSYSSYVLDKQGIKRFIKIRISTDLFQQLAFFHSYSVGRALDKKSLPLREYTNRLIEGRAGGEDDYLLFEFKEGWPLGSRKFHDVIKFMMSDISSLRKIHDSIQSFPTPLLPSSFRHRGADFFKELIMNDVPLDQAALARVYSDKEIRAILGLTTNRHQMELLDESATTFQHGDFQAPNFVKTPSGKLILIDFDQSSISNKFYDVAYFANHAFRKPGLRDQFLASIIDEGKMNEEEKIIWDIDQFVSAFVWVKIFLEKEAFYKKNYVRDFKIRKMAFEWRVKKTKKLLEKLERAS